MNVVPWIQRASLLQVSPQGRQSNSFLRSGGDDGWRPSNKSHSLASVNSVNLEETYNCQTENYKSFNLLVLDMRGMGDHGIDSLNEHIVGSRHMTANVSAKGS